MSNKKDKDSGKRVVKGRDWTFIVYPDSAPSNWREILDGTHLRWVESPLHDKDVNEDGTIKKAHWHVLMSFDGPVTEKPCTDISQSINATSVQKVGSAKGLVRYMIHMDNPEKFQYNRDDIIGHGGADVAVYFELTATNRLELLKEIMMYIYENEVENFADFVMICIQQSDDWFDTAVNYNTMAINKMIDAVWQKNNRNNNDV